MLALGLLPDIPVWQVVLLGCNILAFAVLLIHIVAIRLTRSYPALVSWLAFNVALGFVPLVVHMSFLFYYWFFMAAESCSLVLYLLTVLELYGKVLKSLPGLASTARILIQIVVPASALVSAALIAAERAPVSYVDWFYRVEGAVITTLLFFVVMITAFMVWFPVRVARNTLVYSLGYAAFLLPEAASLFLRNSGHGANWLRGAVGMIMSTLCLSFWALNISRAGETATVSPGEFFRSRDQERLIGHLEAVNRTLMRASRK